MNDGLLSKNDEAGNLANAEISWHLYQFAIALLDLLYRLGCWASELA
ncbi:hypothetical protein [Tolypothrix sp. FACHB-123]|nr:hypothetical protein [Tolypothrix sp. FACHB-123]